MFIYKEIKDIDKEQLLSLYQSVGWSAYNSDIEVLYNAVLGSSYVCSAWEENTLVALIRCISDDASIMYLQDILVRPSHQKKGIGRFLVERVLEKYKHVRQKVLLTDDRPEKIRFYEQLGYKNTKDFGTLNAFVLFSS